MYVLYNACKICVCHSSLPALTTLVSAACGLSLNEEESGSCR